MKKLLAAVLVCTLVLTLGLPAFAADTSGDMVMLNGSYISFGGNAPFRENGRIMVPCSPLLDAIGAGYSDDPTTGRITAVYNEISVELYPGVAGFVLYTGGQRFELGMDAAPQMKNGQLYVPVRFVSQALGLSVSWDEQTQSVVLIDFSKIASVINKKFSIINKLSQLSVDPLKTYAYDGAISMLLDVASEDEEPIHVKLDGTYSDVERGGNASGLVTYTTNAAEVLAAQAADYPAESPEELAEYTKKMESMAALLAEVRMDFIVDSTAGVYYAKSPIIDYLVKEFATIDNTAGSWYKIDLVSTLAVNGLSTGIDLNSIGSMVKADLGSVASALLMAIGNYGAGDYQTMMETIGIVESLLGDKAFKTVKNEDGSTTYAYALNKELLMGGIMNGILSSPMLLQSMMANAAQYTDVNSAAAEIPEDAANLPSLNSPLMAGMADLPDFGVALEINVKDNHTYSCKAEITLQTGEPEHDGYADVKAVINTSVPGKNSIELSVKFMNGGKTADMQMKMDYTMTETLVLRPANAPADGAPVVDLAELMNKNG